MSKVEFDHHRQTHLFKQSLSKAVDEERYDDAVLLLANRLKTRQGTVSVRTRSAIPIDEEHITPIYGTLLTLQEIAHFDIRDKGWHLVAFKDHVIIGAERLRHTEKRPFPKKSLLEQMEAVLNYYGSDALIMAAYHHQGVLIDWQFLCDFDPKPKHL